MAEASPSSRRPGRSCSWGWYRIPAITPTWPSYAPGDALVCVTDGVTERTDGVRQFDDDNGLARLISGWAGLPAAVIADRIRAAVDDFAGVPPHDDVAVLVLAALSGRLFPVDLTRPTRSAARSGFRIRWLRGAAGRCRALGRAPR